ncbi:ABC transporter ATP-binding protein [Nitratireductor alexandrii]|uniref:ABC transporter ATP-binding protein n=1 Tax=Nitratireductor alexandrii TaxID=2448161 RepID=UPI001EE914F7|nr:ABC transporter ATP-binding protein [Nitratireductor alexandrii]
MQLATIIKAQDTLGPMSAKRSNAPTLLDCERVSKIYHGRQGPVIALEEIDLTVPRGEFLSVVGPSGCGKTTLLNLVAGLERVTGGRLSVSGEVLNAPLTDVGIVFQDATLMDWRTVLDNVMLQVEVRRLPVEPYRARALDLLSNLGLEGFLDAYPSQLSGGMKQRVSIARALVHKPSLLLMDEPFSALDALTRDKLNVDMQALCLAEETTTLFITHSITDAAFLGDRVVVMTPRPGRIAEIIDIDLPRPRPLALRETPQFGEYTGRIRTIFESAGVL